MDERDQRAVTRPNILVVLSDQQRPDSCGVFGQRLAVTPRLDRLAADGVAFDNAFTIQPVCGPARAAIQTGSYPTTTGCWRNGIALPPGQATLADRIDDQAGMDHRPERMELELKAGHDAEVAAAAPQRPEQIGVIVRARAQGLRRRARCVRTGGPDPAGRA